MVGFLNSLLPICLMFHFLLHMPVWGTAEEFVVLGPTEPIVALLGTDITLPCRLSPMMSAENMEIRWFRSQISEAVFVFQDGMEQAGEQLTEYMGRTEVISDFINEGRLAVKIYNVQMSDSGEYRCLFKRGNTHQEAILEVQVAGLGSAPHLSLAGYEDGGILLACTTDGWFPEPQVQCRDNRGGKLLFLSETQTQNGGFFCVKASIVVRDSSVRTVSCSIHNTLLDQEKKSAIVIPEAFFPRTSPWKKALIGILSVSGILLGVSIFFILKERKTLSKLLQAKEEEQRTKEKLIEELGRRKALYDSAWRKAHIYADWRKDHFQALPITLDPASAHHDLIISKKDKHAILIQANKEHGEENCSVLGQKPIISGRYHWEVEVEAENKSTWYLGICREKKKREGFVPVSPGKGFWTVGCLSGQFKAIIDKKEGAEAPLLGLPPKQVGIFLDHEAGDISFYNMTDGSYIYNFHAASFSGPVYPYFSIQSLNSSFTICSVSDRTESVPVLSLESQEQEQLHGLEDKNWASEDKSALTQSPSPFHYELFSQDTE